jgi:glycerol-3-phosphate dehydrogenase
LKKFDIIIIGGGITGAGIALEASLRGLKVALFEKNDFASGTSSKSTKLIHGGLRYLKNGELGLVWKTARERKTIKKFAPNLVFDDKMLVPIYQNSSFNKLTLKLGLTVYDFLAGVKKHEKHHMLSKEETLLLEPMLEDQQLKSGGIYTEYRCDDTRLVLAVLKTAEKHGASIFNHIEVSGFDYDINGKIGGIQTTNQLGGNQLIYSAPLIINATGAWLDEVRQKENRNEKPKLKLSKGIHLVFPYAKLPIKQNLYFEASDQRMIFCIIRQGKVYVGTTDTAFPSIKDALHPSQSDIKYLLKQIAIAFPAYRLANQDIESTWTGLRPLIFDGKSKTADISRKDEIFVSPSGMINIAGGKLTGFLGMAKQLTAYLEKKKLIQPCLPHQLENFDGCEFQNDDEIIDYIERQTGESKQIGGNFKTISRLVHCYGKKTEVIIEIAFNLWPKESDKNIVLWKAEMLYAIKNEWVKTPSDFWIRRCNALYFDYPNLILLFNLTLDWFSETLQLSPNQKKELEYQFLNELDLALNFNSKF